MYAFLVYIKQKIFLQFSLVVYVYKRVGAKAPKNLISGFQMVQLQLAYELQYMELVLLL